MEILFQRGFEPITADIIRYMTVEDLKRNFFITSSFHEMLINPSFIEKLQKYHRLPILVANNLEELFKAFFSKILAPRTTN